METCAQLTSRRRLRHRRRGSPRRRETSSDPTSAQGRAPQVIARWTRGALGDLRRFTDHIARENPLAAAEVLSVVQNKVARLQPPPLLGRMGAFEGARELAMRRPYIVTYRVHADEMKVLQVWRAAHARPPGPGTKEFQQDKLNSWPRPPVSLGATRWDHAP